MAQQQITIGARVAVYDDPITRKNFEGEAKVKKVLHKHARHLEAYPEEGVTLWACQVVFTGETFSYTRMIAVDN